MKLGMILLCAAGLLPAAERVVFTKVFPGSVPAYVSISVDAQGATEYREDADDDRPLRFAVSPREAQTVFGLAAKLNFFKDKLESGAKVARMGLKTFRYEKDGAGQQATFNFTDNLDARELADWFERVSETEQHRARLERAAKYDKLGVNQALLEVQSGWEQKRLVAPEQLLPLLDRVAKNETYLHMARTRAAALAGQIRAGESGATP
ncbi:MAG TPA: hypothetical protein DEQ47_15125 [Solibacterales bacterium]|nr:hypothetical protein [Bryobacterales bacterium]